MRNENWLEWSSWSLKKFLRSRRYRYFNYYPTKVEFVSTVAMDLTTLTHLKFWNKVGWGSSVISSRFLSGIRNQPAAIEKTRDQPVLSGLMLPVRVSQMIPFQSFSQILPFVGCFITFAYITPHLESDFGWISSSYFEQNLIIRPISLHNRCLARRAFCWRVIGIFFFEI